MPKSFPLDSGSNLMAGAKAYWYITLTTTPKDTYTDYALSVANTNPVVADGNGIFPTTFLKNDVRYRLTLKTSADVLIYTQDDIGGPVITQAELGAILYPRTAAELAAGVTPTNYQYAPGNVLRYGTNTTPGTTDMTAAFVSACIANGPTVYVPPGTYLVSQFSPAAGQTVQGDGALSIIKQKVVAESTWLINVASKAGVTIRDLTLDGNGNAQPAGEHIHGVYFSEATDCGVLNCVIHDFQGDDVYITSVTDPTSSLRILIADNIIYNLGRQGITVAGKGARNITVARNKIRVGTYVTPSTSHGNPIHLELDTVPSAYIGDILIQGNNCEDAGISMSGPWAGVSILGNTIRTPKYTASPWGIASVAPHEVVINGNIIIGDNSTVLDGIFVEDSSSVSPTVVNIVVSNNVVKQVAGHGINIFGVGSGIPSVGQISVTGNTVDTVGTGGSKQGIVVSTSTPNLLLANNIIKNPTNIGIAVQGSPNFLIANNRVTEWAGTYAIYTATNAAIGAGPGLITGNHLSCATPAGKTGIRVENEATNTGITISNNDCRGTATPVNIGAAAVKCSSWGNIGGNDAITGSFTCAAAATTTTNNANVTAACRIHFIPTNAAAGTLMGGTKSLFVSARTPGTSFAVRTADNTAAAGTETFDYWISV